MPAGRQGILSSGSDVVVDMAHNLVDAVYTASTAQV